MKSRPSLGKRNPLGGLLPSALWKPMTSSISTSFILFILYLQSPHYLLAHEGTGGVELDSMSQLTTCIDQCRLNQLVDLLIYESLKA
jgi:hypothetical protein